MSRSSLVTAILRGRSATGGARRGPRRPARPARPDDRARAPSRPAAARARSPPVIASSRSQKREAIAGAARIAPRPRDEHLAARRAPCAKSCAATPIRRSSPGRPRSARMRGASHGSGAGSAGHTPSFSPPRIIRSACCSRASISPQMNTRGWPPCGGRTATASISLAQDRGDIVGRASSPGPRRRRRFQRGEQLGGGAPRRAGPGRIAGQPPSPPRAAPRAAPASDAPPANAASSGASSARASRHQPSPRRAAAARARRRRPDSAVTPASPAGGRGPRSARSSRRAPSSHASRCVALRAPADA